MNTMQSFRRNQKGIGLVEIMVALVVGLVLMGGVFQIFQSARMTYRVTEALARVQENGRFAMMFLSHDLRMAGYSGCSRDIPLKSTLNDSGNYIYDFQTYLIGHIDKNKNGNWLPALPAGISDAVNGTDIITVRAAESSAAKILPPYMNQLSAALHIEEGSGLSAGDIVLVSDCQMGTVFQISGGNPDVSGAVVHNTGNSVVPGNSTKDLGKTYKGDAELMRIKTTTYFLRKNAAGEPALWRRIGSNSAEKLVEGVDDMTVSYGVDTGADGSADAYRTADQVASWEDVVSVQLTLRVRSREDNITGEAETVSYDGQSITDQRLRQTFTSTIGIRNRLR